MGVTSNGTEGNSCVSKAVQKSEEGGVRCGETIENNRRIREITEPSGNIYRVLPQDFLGSLSNTARAGGNVYHMLASTGDKQEVARQSTCHATDSATGPTRLTPCVLPPHPGTFNPQKTTSLPIIHTEGYFLAGILSLLGCFFLFNGFGCFLLVLFQFWFLFSQFVS